MDVSQCMTYRDPHAAIEFLERALGFERGAVYEEEGRIVHAEIWHGDSCVMLGAERDDSLGKPPGSAWTYVAIEDADEHHARAVEAGAEVVMELTDTDYGSRDYAVRDREGNVWNFGTYRPARPA